LPAPKVAQASPEPNLIGDLAGKIVRTPQKRLEQIVDLNEERAAAVLRHLVRS
jgi:flagellar M-ring protein FliF